MISESKELQNDEKFDEQKWIQKAERVLAIQRWGKQLHGIIIFFILKQRTHFSQKQLNLLGL